MAPSSSVIKFGRRGRDGWRAATSRARRLARSAHLSRITESVGIVALLIACVVGVGLIGVEMVWARALLAIGLI